MIFIEVQRFWEHHSNPEINWFSAAYGMCWSSQRFPNNFQAKDIHEIYSQTDFLELFNRKNQHLRSWRRDLEIQISSSSLLKRHTRWTTSRLIIWWVTPWGDPLFKFFFLVRGPYVRCFKFSSKLRGFTQISCEWYVYLRLIFVQIKP